MTSNPSRRLRGLRRSLLPLCRCSLLRDRIGREPSGIPRLASAAGLPPTDSGSRLHAVQTEAAPRGARSRSRRCKIFCSHGRAPVFAEGETVDCGCLQPLCRCSLLQGWIGRGLAASHGYRRPLGAARGSELPIPMPTIHSQFPTPNNMISMIIIEKRLKYSKDLS